MEQHKDVERLLRSHGWLLDEVREVPSGEPPASGSMFANIVDLEPGVLESCVQLTALGVRKRPGQFPARQLELLLAEAGLYVIGIDGRSSLGPEPRVTTTRVMLAQFPE
ncbi:MAG: hypothetical protein GY711_17930 [bacterium]|nr:hypothetical protein [bacterium]